MPRQARNSRRSRVAEQKRSETLKAVRNVLVVVFVVLLVGAFYVKSVLSRRHVDPDSGCPADIAAETVLLVDVTDPMNTPQRQDFRNQLDRLLSQIKRYEKLTIVKVDPVGDSLLKPVIARCNPGSARDENQVNGNPEKLAAEHEKMFVSPMERAFESLAVASGSNRSPVMESVQSVALSEFQKSGMEGKPKRLILASDLLQNTEAVSFYKGLPDAEAFMDSQTFQRVSTDLKGVDVELWMLQRGDSSHTQPRALTDFWERLIEKQQGQVSRVYRVSG